MTEWLFNILLPTEWSNQIFTEGMFAFGYPLSGFSLLLILIGLAGLAYFSYRPVQHRMSRFSLVLLTTLRTSILSVLLLILLKPFLRLHDTQPQASYLAVLVDQSKSMQIADLPDQGSRIETVNQTLFNPIESTVRQDSLYLKLQEKFKVRAFGFDRAAYPIPAQQPLSAIGWETDLETAIRDVAKELQHLPLSGIIIFSDGIDQTRRQLAPQHLLKLAYQMRDRKIPIHTVGVGSEEAFPDFMLQPIKPPSIIEEDQPARLPLTIKRSGKTASTVNVRLIHDGRVVSRQEVNFGTDLRVKRTKLSFVPRRAGVQRYRVEIEAEEMVPQNNSQDLLLKVVPSQRLKVLYLEGGPRQEFSFLKRTLKKDPNILLTDRYRTSNLDNQHFGGTRFSSAGTSSASTRSFFPTTRTELFDYDAIIIGNLSATAFTDQQLQQIADFVRLKGGGLLLLGGSLSLSHPYREGSYLATPIASVLPVEIELGQPLATDYLPTSPSRFKFTLSDAGRKSPLLTFADGAYDNLRQWYQLPDLIGYSKVKRAKAGAVVLATHPSDRNQFGPRILLARHEYNRGRAMIFTPHDSWRWQMMTRKDDTRYHRFWRQVVKWVATSPTKRLMVDLKKATYAPDERVELRATVLDSDYQLANRATVTAYLTRPETADDANSNLQSEAQEIRLDSDLAKPGLYTAYFNPPQQGDYKVQVQATLPVATPSSIGETNDRSKPSVEILGPEVTLFTVADAGQEFATTPLNRKVLEQLSAASGGRYYSLTDTDQPVTQMFKQIPLVESATTQLRIIYLWDLPLILAILIFLFGLEWIYRKKQGLV